MKRCIALAAVLASCFAAAAQTPQATDLPGKPFFIKKTWVIGGEGNWDYLTLDPNTLQLFIPHGHAVQVVDVNAGQMVGQVTGLRDAHGIALDHQGQYGYVSDSSTDDIKVFDRTSFEVIGHISTGRNPRSVVLDETSDLIFVICPDTAPESQPQRNGQTGQLQRTGSGSSVQSTVTVIDRQTRRRMADILVPGRLGFAQGDGKGSLYINVLDRNEVVYFHTASIASWLRGERPAGDTRPDGNPADGSATEAKGPEPDLRADIPSDGNTAHASSQPFLVADLTTYTQAAAVPFGLHTLNLGSGCRSPHGLAVDGADSRLFVACENMKMVVVNPGDGSQVATLPIGAGNDAIGYDADRGLIYASNGGGVGSLTIIRRDISDGYHVIQELPTQARARTLAVNPANGEVYLVTNILGFDRSHNGGIGGLQNAPVAGSFQVLVVGN